MTHPFTPTSRRIAGILALGVLLAGCNYNRANDGVRNGPQAVHPSTSALAQGAAFVPCGGEGQVPCE